jgi:hypothetical protein
MRKKVTITAGIGAALAAGALFSPIGLADAGHENTVLTADLDGRQEVATGATNNRRVGDPNGTGEAYVFGIDGDLNTLCYVLTVDRIATATGAHIHEGARGENGPVVVSLAAPADGNAGDCLTEGEPGKFLTDTNGVPLTTVQEILANPENYYVNVHNAEFPGGAIRGQLMAER